MKVLIVFNQPAPYKVNLFNELAKTVDLDVIFDRKTCSNRDPLFYKSNKYNFNYRFLKRGAFGEEQSFTFELKKIIKREHKKYDLIIMNGYATISEIIAIRYMVKNRIKFSLLVNGGLIHNDRGIRKYLKHKIISSCSSFISPCEECDKYLIHYGANKDFIYHYPNSTIFENEIVSSLLSDEEIREKRKENNLPTDKKIFICPTQFIKRKNNFNLLRIFKTNKDKILLLIGNGKQETSYISYIKENNMNNVLIMPYKKKKELLDFYKISDALITLSKEDIYGHTINEAMSQGLPVISTNKVVSANHLVKDNINGFVVPLNDNEKLQFALDNINHKMGEQAIKTSKENTIEKSSKNLIKIFKEIK